MRIVTTLPSATEIVTALGLEPVGVSHECDYPPSVRSLPAVTASSVDADAGSSEIDRQVLESVAEGDGVYDVDLETLEELEPELIVTQGVCDVCAVDEVVVERAVERIDAEPEILTTDPHTVGDVLDDVERIGEATGKAERARAVVDDLENRIESVRSRANDERRDSSDAVTDSSATVTHSSTEPSGSSDRPRVAVFDWTDPVMVAGHWTADLVEWAGGEYGLADPGEASRPREWGEIRAYDPEVIVVAPCGFDLAQTAANLSDLTALEGWAELSAVRNDRVWAMDGNHYLNRPGPRLVETLETLAPIISPDRFERPPDESVAVPLERLDRTRV
ncbi:iron ABC transporter substrate-binding protein [Halostagnicola sp. A56]|uniref:ABC transporter substrate-binding protein n=1 Tax=Halostagnicola sp. A56 TaxID=1495067 RepID=UPI0004A1954A|nr:ABC transporter substrate-binding protein [Halostagnicola sp. A56]KDE59949.1 iron ABC transporter substrate-binding protein [Halostagnicola sp. A56]